MNQKIFNQNSLGKKDQPMQHEAIQNVKAGTSLFDFLSFAAGNKLLLLGLYWCHCLLLYFFNAKNIRHNYSKNKDLNSNTEFAFSYW